MAGAMRQARHLVAGTEAGVGDHLARRRVHRFARRARLRGGERRGLRALSRGSRRRSAAVVGLPKTVVRVMSD